jgi:signal peptidase II
MKKLFYSRFLRITMFCVSSVLLISWDRVTKDLAKEHLRDKPVHSYFHDSFRLMYTENAGAALSLGESLSKISGFWLLSVLPLLCLLGFLMYILKKSGQTSYKRLFVFSLIFAGGMGNIIDRVWNDRHVTDFMNIGIWNVRSGIFNFADVWITTGIMCFLFFGRYRKVYP